MGFKNPYDFHDIIEIKDYKDINFVIFAKEKHDHFDYFVYGIIDKKGNQYLMGKESLKKIKKTKKAKEEPIEEVKEKPFPKIMKEIDSELIVYFTKKGVGHVFKFNHEYYFGYFSDDWNMSCFEDVNEEITVTLK